MEKFCDEVIPFISQQEVILYNIKKETGLNDVSVIEDVENLRTLNRILDGVLTIKSQFYQYFISIVENPVKSEDKQIKNLFNLLFNNELVFHFKKNTRKLFIH